MLFCCSTVVVIYGKTCGQLNGNWACHRACSLSPLYFPIKPPSPSRHTCVWIFQDIDREPCGLGLDSPHNISCGSLNPGVTHSYLWSPVFALVIAFDKPKSRLFMWSVRGGSIPFPSDSCPLIWYRSTAKLGIVQRGPDLLVFVLCSIAVVMGDA